MRVELSRLNRWNYFTPAAMGFLIFCFALGNVIVLFRDGPTFDGLLLIAFMVAGIVGFTFLHRALDRSLDYRSAPLEIDAARVRRRIGRLAKSEGWVEEATDEADIRFLIPGNYWKSAKIVRIVFDGELLWVNCMSEDHALAGDRQGVMSQVLALANAPKGETASEPRT